MRDETISRLLRDFITGAITLGILMIGAGIVHLVWF